MKIKYVLYATVPQIINMFNLYLEEIFTFYTLTLMERKGDKYKMTNHFSSNLVLSLAVIIIDLGYLMYNIFAQSLMGC